VVASVAGPKMLRQIKPMTSNLQEDLERLFGRRVDLVAKDGLHRVIRDQVLADAQVLYAA
jgi:predicted nucleotidyltransferase